ncbi:MAG: hypothetical protein QOJ75_261 [Chloroflexota bacterium]|jgi:hypothetical protein|nr:hypothetical protein [Chloroflexota bacterium]
MPHPTTAADLQTAWRKVELALESTAEGTKEAEALRADALRLRNAYQRLVEEAWQRNEPALPPLDRSEVEA